jgi:hypothetical protein
LANSGQHANGVGKVRRERQRHWQIPASTPTALANSAANAKGVGKFQPRVATTLGIEKQERPSTLKAFANRYACSERFQRWQIPARTPTTLANSAANAKGVGKFQPMLATTLAILKQELPSTL